MPAAKDVAVSTPSPYTARPGLFEGEENPLSAITEINSIVMQGTDGDFRLWRYRPLDELGLKEEDLERAIVAQPKALVMDPLELLTGKMWSSSRWNASSMLPLEGATKTPFL